MYLHLGQETILRTRDILGVFDLDTATISKHTRDFLAKAEHEGRVTNVSPELPKTRFPQISNKVRITEKY